MDHINMSKTLKGKVKVLRVLRSIKPKCRQMEGDITWV
jgi:hypothetical protein